MDRTTMKSDEASLSTLQTAEVEHEQQVVNNEKSQKRISGVPSQANDFIKLSMARRTAAAEAAGNTVETLRERGGES